MNLYFLVEDEKSFFKVLPEWLGFLTQDYQRVSKIQDMTKNSYLLESGHGVTRIVTTALFASIETILKNPGHTDEFIVIMDAENLDAEACKNKITNLIAENYPQHREWPFKVRIFICDCCFETWLLGNRELYPLQEDDALRQHLYYPYYRYYDICHEDPAKMLKDPQSSLSTRASYHFNYLHAATQFQNRKDRTKPVYRKARPEAVAQQEFFEQLCRRADETDHNAGFTEFYRYLQRL